MAYGIEAASQTYFGKPASELLLPNARCWLVCRKLRESIIHLQILIWRWNVRRVVLGLMEKNGFITAAQRVDAENSPLSYNPAPYPIEAPHFIWMVKDQLDELFASGTLNLKQSLVIRTTLDLDMQHLAEEIVKRRIAAVQAARRRDQPQR